MREEGVVDRVKFYSKHPKKIALCILVDDNKKLLARALIWRLDSPEGVIFMDRIYYVRPEHEMMLAKYAQDHNMKTKLSGYNNKVEMQVEITPFTPGEPQPYLDTMHYRDNVKKFTNR